MYLTIDQVLMVRDASKIKASDPVVYGHVHPVTGERVFSTDANSTPYGRLYFDSRDTPCIVPDEWNQDDAMLAKDWR